MERRRESNMDWEKEMERYREREQERKREREWRGIRSLPVYILIEIVF